MKLEEYKSGEYVKMNDYKAFIPSKINYNWGWDDTKLDKLLSEANRQIGELNAYSLLIPNVDLYIKMHVKIEANKSNLSFFIITRYLFVKYIVYYLFIHCLGSLY